MSQLYLVRHGQASFFAENYDRLSTLGELQARRLGEFFAARSVRFDAAFSGPAVRQQRTAEIIATTMTDLGCPCPAPSVLAGLNEHSGDKLLSAPHARAFFERHPELGALATAFREAREPDDVQKSFQRLFEAVVRRWTDGQLAVPGVEQWQEFHDRARLAIESITSHPERGRTTLAVSSVGPITIALQTALKASIPISLDLGWRLRNASVTTFLYTPKRLTLDGFNSVAHLANPEEITYR
ncbi:MAG TPA: histidine phosphatase family protein [Planctomycetaceae bacterium]|jgi:broad specificity phosphatase PhoE|nr:histidine phosphatase family protein [Planctomycetaceae bacterium]